MGKRLRQFRMGENKAGDFPLLLFQFQIPLMPLSIADRNHFEKLAAFYLHLSIAFTPFVFE